MNISWDNIKYLFQIPLEWFRKISNRVFNAYGSNFINVTEGYYGGLEIGIDIPEFADTVNSCLSGYVKSVDSITPDANGNVELTGLVKSVNQETPNLSGDVEIDVGVKTINSNPPDANGNINIAVSADTSDCLKIDDWMNANSQHSVSPYYYANAAYTGNLPAGVTNLYDWVGALQYNSLDAYLESLGYQKDDDLGDLAYLDEIVVDGHTSDLSGEVSFGLAGGKWVVTDADGHLATTNDEPIAIDTTQYTPVNVANQKVVTGVKWNGTKLQYKYQNWTFVKGVLVEKSNELTADIDTPTVVTWA